MPDRPSTQQWPCDTQQLQSQRHETQSASAEHVLIGVVSDVQYIYFSMDELKHLAQIIQSKGRISIAEVAREASAMLMVPAAGVEGNDTGEKCTEEVLGGLIAA